MSFLLSAMNGRDMTLEIAAAEKLSRVNGKTPDENLRLAADAAHVLPWSIIQILEVALNTQMTLDMLTRPRYNLLYNEIGGEEMAKFTFENSQEVQSDMFTLAKEVWKFLYGPAPASGWDEFDQVFDMFQFFMRDPDSFDGSTVSVEEAAAQYQEFWSDQFGA